jgi:HEPN domain-containing protein
MSPEQELVCQWLKHAKSDLANAEYDLTAQSPFIEDSCFHCQQAIEKLLKAYLAYQGIEFGKTHEIEFLIDLCKGKEAAFEQIKDLTEPLTAYAVRFRYPYPGPALTVEQAYEAIAIARKVWGFVIPWFPKEIVP